MMKESASDGLGLPKKQDEVITLDEEKRTGSKAVKGLLKIVKAKDKQTGFECLAYREDISETNACGLKHREIRGKITCAYENRKQ